MSKSRGGKDTTVKRRREGGGGGLCYVAAIAGRSSNHWTGKWNGTMENGMEQ